MRFGPCSWFRWAGSASLALILSACVPNGQEPLPTTAEPAAHANSASVPQELRQQVDFALEDLASRLGIDRGSIQIQEARRVTWRSGAIGCPQPGLGYTQALVPGLRITLRSDGRTFHYHAAGNGQPFHCPSERAESPLDAEPESERS
jgi:hypothetical protein